MGFAVQCYSAEIEQHHTFELVYWEDENLLGLKRYVNVSDGYFVAGLKPEVVEWLSQYDDAITVTEDWYGCTINIYDDNVAMLFKMWWM